MPVNASDTLAIHPAFAVAGKIGIGTTSPDALLSISNTASTAANTPLLSIASPTGGAATSTLLTILANGKMGIGTAAPTTTLDVRSGVGGIQLNENNAHVLRSNSF